MEAESKQGCILVYRYIKENNQCTAFHQEPLFSCSVLLGFFCIGSSAQGR